MKRKILFGILIAFILLFSVVSVGCKGSGDNNDDENGTYFPGGEIG